MIDALIDRAEINNAYIEHTIGVAKLKPLKEYTAETVGKRTMEYLKKCEVDGIRPNLSAYAMSLGTTPDGLNELILDHRIPEEGRNALLKGVSMIEATMISLMMDQRMNPVTSIFLLKNHFGYKDQSEISFKGRIETDKKSLEAKYRAVIDDD